MLVDQLAIRIMIHPKASGQGGEAWRESQLEQLRHVAKCMIGEDCPSCEHHAGSGYILDNTEGTYRCQHCNYLWDASDDPFIARAFEDIQEEVWS